MSETTLNVRIQNRSDLEANWASVDPVLMSGEVAISSDKNNFFKVGDGTSKWSELTYNSAVSALTAEYADYSTQALTDDKGQQIDTTYVSGVNVEQLEDSSVKITVTKGDASSEVFSFTDKDTTYETMKGASNTAAGLGGLVPAPEAGDNRKFLSGAGTWESVEIGAIGDMIGATAESDGDVGLVPAPSTGEQNKFLKGDGTWAIPENTTYSAMTGCTNLAAGKSGLVPAPEASSVTKFLSNKGTWDEVDLSVMTGASSIKDGNSGLVPAPEAGQQDQFLRGDGTWATPVNTTYGNANTQTYGLTRLYTSTGSNTDGSMTQDAVTIALNSKSTTTHTHTSDDIVSLDASKLTGSISIDLLPKGALERCVVVENDTARLTLTIDEVQNGDTVIVNNTGVMYFVKDDTKLASEDGYAIYTAGAATSVPWSGITGVPATFTPSSHYHTISDITDLEVQLGGKANSVHQHVFTDITGTISASQLPTSGVTAGTYKSVAVDQYGRVTAGSNPTTLEGYGITDAASKTHTHVLEVDDITGLHDELDAKSDTGHTHSYLPLAGGTLTGKVTIKSATSESNAYGSTNPTLAFSNSDGSQLISLIFTDYDSIANPASVTLIGNAGGEYFIAPNIKATTDLYEGSSKLSDKYQAKGNYAGSSSDGGAATSAVKWSTARNINGLSINGEADRVNYGTCSTTAATSAKVVDCIGFSLITGSEITVKFTVTNTAANPTLNVNGTGAKSIYYRGAAIAADYLAANRTYTFRYNGTQYDLVGDLNTDTNTKVTQSVSTTTNYRAILLGSTNNTDTAQLTTTVTDQTYVASGIYVQPSTGDLRATKFNGYTLAAACAKGVTNLTAKAALGWADATTGANTVPTLNTLAYWNGCYSGTSSNLTYCVKGAFGDAATRAVATSATSGSTALITSGAVYSALAAKAKGANKSATTAATVGWYRIATSAASINNCTGIFQIVAATAAGKHTSALITANTSYGIAASSAITVLNCAHYTTSAITKVRIVYHTSYQNNYVYLEVYNPSATAIPITVDLIGGAGWTLVAPSTAGSVPSGYSSKEYTLINGTITGNMDFGEET